jgi:hypothetical protein
MDNIRIISREEYENDIKLMNHSDSFLFKSFTNNSDLNDTEQIIASLKCIVPEFDEKKEDFSTLAKEKAVTGEAHNFSFPCK